MCGKKKVICAKIEISKPSSISNGICCAYFLTNFHGNSMNTICPLRTETVPTIQMNIPC